VLPLHLPNLLLLLLHNLWQLQLHLIRQPRVAHLHRKLVLVVAPTRLLLRGLGKCSLVHVQEPNTRLLRRIILVLQRYGPVYGL